MWAWKQHTVSERGGGKDSHTSEKEKMCTWGKSRPIADKFTNHENPHNYWIWQKSDVNMLNQRSTEDLSSCSTADTLF